MKKRNPAENAVSSFLLYTRTIPVITRITPDTSKLPSVLKKEKRSSNRLLILSCSLTVVLKSI
jgi:hypothetical protein